MKRISIYCAIYVMILSICCVYTFKPVEIAWAEKEFSVSGKSGFLMDNVSGEVLFENNADARLPVASMVKLMTTLLIFEDIEAGRLSITDKITTTENAAGMGGSQVFIDPFVEYRAEDLIKTVIISSANDASVALAEHLSGSEEAFVKRMNGRAGGLGMKNTLYKNCTGLPSPEQYSSARDSAIVLSELLKHDGYHKYSSVWIDELLHPSGRKTELVNTNKLVRYFKGCDAGKTGSTNEAGFCLATTAKRNGMRLISVIVGSPTGKERFDDSARLLNYGFNNFENKLLVKKGESLGRVKILKGKLTELEIFACEDYSAVARKGEDSGYEIKVEIPGSVNAPVKAGVCIGKVRVYKDGGLVREINAAFCEDAEALGFKDGFKKVVSLW